MRPCVLQCPRHETEYYLAPVAFSLEVEYLGDDPDHPETIDLYDEDALRGWAEERFLSYAIWDMEVPKGALVDEPTTKTAP